MNGTKQQMWALDIWEETTGPPALGTGRKERSALDLEVICFSSSSLSHKGSEDTYRWKEKAFLILFVCPCVWQFFILSFSVSLIYYSPLFSGSHAFFLVIITIFYEMGREGKKGQRLDCGEGCHLLQELTIISLSLCWSKSHASWKVPSCPCSK